MGDRRPVARWERRTDEAWRAFRRRLADHVAMLGEDEVVLLEVEVGPDEDELDGAAPYVQLIGWGDGELVRVEASSNHYLDDSFRLDRRGEQVLASAGWSAPTHAPDEPGDEGSANWWGDHALRDADLVAHLVTVALRDAFGCPHPAFVWSGGAFDVDDAEPGLTEPSADERAEAAARAGRDDEPSLRHPQGADELRQMVVEAIEQAVSHPVELDEDGDVPLPAGRSVLYVQPLDHEPTVRLWARLVTSVDDRARAADEVAMANRDLLFGTVVLTDDGHVDLVHHVCALPFVPQQLWAVVGRILSDLDRRASDFARRVGGQLFLAGAVTDDASADTEDIGDAASRRPDQGDGGAEPGPASDVPGVPTELLVLRELLHAGAADPRTVAALWDGDLHALALQIDDLLAEPPAALDVADAVAALRAALVFVAERRSRARWTRSVRPHGRRRSSQQDELIPSSELGEATLDLGVDG